MQLVLLITRFAFLASRLKYYHSGKERVLHGVRCPRFPFLFCWFVSVGLCAWAYPLLFPLLLYHTIGMVIERKKEENSYWI